MSSKNNIKKSDNYNDKAEQQALKEVEIIAELGPNEKTRKEAEKLIETVENGSATTFKEQEPEAIETVLDETKRTIKQTANEAREKFQDIPKQWVSYKKKLYRQLRKLGTIVYNSKGKQLI